MSALNALSARAALTTPAPRAPVPAPVLAMAHVSLEFPTYRGAVQALSDVSIHVAPGEIVALVGESGSGKSVAAMTAIRLLPPKLFRLTGGHIAVVGRDVFTLPARALARIRGRQVSMVFQEPMSALNPTRRIGVQICEVLRRHGTLGRTQAAARAGQLLADMQVADPSRVLRSYAFELSGGMRQRVLLAMAFACNPQLLIADEPTTALDVTVQAQVLTLIREQARAHGTAVLFISHDLAVVSQLCTRIYVMYAGRVVEHGTILDVLTHPLHPYTRALLRSLPESAAPGQPLRSISGTVPSLLDPPSGCRFRARCELAQELCSEQPPMSGGADAPGAAAPGAAALAAGAPAAGAACWFALRAPEVVDTASAPQRAAAVGVYTQAQAQAQGQAQVQALVQVRAASVRFPLRRNWRGRPLLSVHALNGVDLDILRGETLAVVGESGCGKSTLAQLIMSLLPLSSGRLSFDGIDLATVPPAQMRRLRQRLQMVFQDPQASLDPRMPAWQLIAEPLRVARRLPPGALRARAAELAELVGIRADQLERYAHEFSGGQRQRLAIARALALEPQLLVLDEPTSALDVSIQAQILNLLSQLQSRLGLTYLFISHNVAVVRHIADRVAVMYLGQIVELGSGAQVLDSPRHPYTQQLIGAVPRLHQPLSMPPAAAAEPMSNLALPAGCFFRARCGWSNAACGAAQPLRPMGDGRWVRCHRAEDIDTEQADRMDRAHRRQE